MEKRDLFEQIINSAIEIFLSYDDDKRILMMNESARKELMYTDNDIGTSVSRLFQNEDMSEITYDDIPVKSDLFPCTGKGNKDGQPDITICSYDTEYIRSVCT